MRWLSDPVRSKGDASITSRSDSPPMSMRTGVAAGDAEPGTLFVNGCSGLIAGDEFLNLVGVKLACPSGFEPADGWGRWRPATPEAPARGD